MSGLEERQTVFKASECQLSCRGPLKGNIGGGAFEESRSWAVVISSESPIKIGTAEKILKLFV